MRRAQNADTHALKQYRLFQNIPRRRLRFGSPVQQGIFLLESTFSADSLTVSVYPPCAIACIYICAYVKDPVVHVRVQWIMETLKHPACTVSRVARLCRSWLSPGEGNPNFPWGKSQWDNIIVKKKIYIYKKEVKKEYWHSRLCP